MPDNQHRIALAVGQGGMRDDRAPCYLLKAAFAEELERGLVALSPGDYRRRFRIPSYVRSSARDQRMGGRVLEESEASCVLLNIVQTSPLPPNHRRYHAHECRNAAGDCPPASAESRALECGSKQVSMRVREEMATPQAADRNNRL